MRLGLKYPRREEAMTKLKSQVHRSRRLRATGHLFLSIVIDGLLLLAWAGLQYGVCLALPLLQERFPHLDRYALQTFRWVFFFATLVPVIVYMGADLLIYCFQITTEAGSDIKKALREWRS